MVDRVARVVQHQEPFAGLAGCLGQNLVKGRRGDLAGAAGRGEDATWLDTAKGQPVKPDVRTFRCVAALPVPGKAGWIEDHDVKTAALGRKLL